MTYRIEPKLKEAFKKLVKELKLKDFMRDFEWTEIIPISEQNGRDARNNFEIDVEEDILFYNCFCYDDRHYTQEETIITTAGIYSSQWSEKNESDNYFVSWLAIEKVKYQDLYMVFITNDEESPTIQIPAKRFVAKRYRDYESLDDFARLFNELANMVQPAADPFDEIKTIWHNVIHDEKAIPNAIQQIEKYIKEEDRENQRAQARDYLSALNWLIGENAEALKYINTSLKLLDDKGCRALRGLIKSEMGEEAPYTILKELVNYKKNSYLISEENYNEAFEKMICKYAESFTSIPPENRRFVILSESFDVLPDEGVYVLPIHHLPKDISIMGDPEDGALYIRHPYNPNMYILAERYSIEIFRDKIEEFQKIMASIGAKHINYIDTYSNQQKTNTTTDKNGNAHIGGAKRGLEIKGESHHESDEQFAFLDEVQENCNYKISKKYPQLPAANKLFWYPHEKRWQDLIEQRLYEDRIDDLTFEVSVSREETIAENTKKKLEMAVNLVLGNINAEGEVQKEWKYEKKSCHTWKCKVEFYPLSDYPKPEEVQPLPKFSDAELEYIERYKEALEDDGQIDEKEKNSLAKYCERHNISKQRQQELEKSISNVSPEEEEYIALYQEAVEDDGVVDAKERTRLDNYCKRHNISAERAKELEKL